MVGAGNICHQDDIASPIGMNSTVAAAETALLDNMAQTQAGHCGRP